MRFFILAFILANSLQADLLNRWSFNEVAGSPTAGTTYVDTVGGMVMTLKGNGATQTGSRIELPGSTLNGEPEATISAYLDLPNGIASSKTDMTVEMWAAPLGARQWAPYFDFGRWSTAGDGLGAPGEWTGNSASNPGPAVSGDAWAIMMSQGMNINQQRNAVTLNGTRLDLDTGLPTTLGQTYHLVVTMTDGAGTFGATGMQMEVYRDGVSTGTLDLPHRLDAIEDVNCWLGRLQWNSLSTANVAYDEVRIYDHALSATEVSDSLLAGPDVVFAPPVLQPDSATLHHQQKVLLDVLANDGAGATAASVNVVTAPSNGTAVPDGDGRILYTHTTGTPLSDSFTYEAGNSGGMGAAVTVTLDFANGLRIANPNLNVPAEPPTTTFQTANAFGALTFNQPINLATIPGDAQRLFVVERQGMIQMIPSVTDPVPSSSVFLDLAGLVNARADETLRTNVDRGFMSMAFHPNYDVNGQFYVWYSVQIGGPMGPYYYRVSRFNVQGGNPNLADASSELILIQQLEPNGFHLGTDMHFGNDGYLYISTGDGGGQFDSRRYGQRIDLDFHCAMLRIDVDKLPGNVEPNSHPSVPTDAGIARYSVPADNPFVTADPNVVFNGVSIPATSVRTEFYSIGLRNPFRFSIDPGTGEIWAGDVGQVQREEINLITNGGNYGWSWREGTIPGPNAGEALPGFTYDDPLYEYVIGNGAMQGHSVTGGFVYRGTNLPSLTGAYVFGDYQDGHIWSLRRTPSLTVERLTGDVGQTAFHPDPSNGDILMADIQEGRIKRLVGGADTGDYPSTLSETGLFADLTDLSPSPGVLPYTPNLRFWSDFADKRRWFVLPDAVSQMTWSREGAWSYPDGMIWVKHFDLETERGNPASSQRIETRVLVKNAAGSYGVSYRWNEAQTEATLVPDAGEDLAINVVEDGVPRVQDYRIPGRAECSACHTPHAGHALSFNTRQLNLMGVMNGFSGNQIELLQAAGYLANQPEPVNTLPRHVRPDETEFSLEARVRSYLAVNCMNCHVAGSAAPNSWDASPELTLAETGLINGLPERNGDDPLNLLIVPGDTTHSIVLNRMAASNGFSRMPPLGSNELDAEGIALITEWINSHLPSQQTYAQWRLAEFGSAVSPEGEPDFDADLDGQDNEKEFLADTDPNDGGSLFNPILGPSATVTNPASFDFSIFLPENRSFQIEQSSDLENWSIWDVPGNGGLPRAGGSHIFTAPTSGPPQYFRVRLWEN